MTHTKNFIINIILSSFLINSTIVGYPILGEIYKSTSENSSAGHTVLLVVEKNSNNNTVDQKIEHQFKSGSIPTIRKLLADDEITIILEDRLDQIAEKIKKSIAIWNEEFEADPHWDSIIEQNYSNPTPPKIVYKKQTLDPKAATKLFVLLSKMKTHIDNLPLKEHLNFVQKMGAQKDNNLFKSCKVAKDYYKLNNKSGLTRWLSAKVTLADIRSRTIMNVTTNYQNGLTALSKELSFLDKQVWPNFLEDIARAFVPQNKDSSYFSPSDKLKTKDLLDDLETILKKLNQFESANTVGAEKILWADFKLQIQKAKEYVLHSVAIFKNLSHDDKDLFAKLFNEMPKYQYAQLPWFAIFYAYMLRDKNPDNAIYPDNSDEWLKILTQDLLYVGLMEGILDSKIKQTKAVVYINQDSYEIISQHLLNLGYTKTLGFNNVNSVTCISAQEFQTLTNQFPVSVARINQLFKPLSYSIKF